MNGVRRLLRWPVAAASLALLLAGGALWAQAQANRSVEGTVLDARGQALAQAVVYLKNSQSQAVQTYITGPDGRFYFHALAPNTNYRVHAVYRGRHSKTRTISAYDTRELVHLSLTVPVLVGPAPKS